MLFNSLEFAIYLPIVFFIYWFVFGNISIIGNISKKEPFFKPITDILKLWHNNLKLQNLFVVVASYIFYGWWDWRFLLLIFLTSIASWYSGILISKWRTVPKKAKAISAANIILNLSILGFFKYYNFFVISFANSVTFLGGHPDIWTLKIILPVGISFYTFQALSYSIDVYREKLPATKDPIAFLAFVSFFPQLVAGPIERATNLLPQFHQRRTFKYNQAVDGLRQMLWGLFKKMVIADNCAVYVNKIWANYAHESSSTLIVAAIFFTFQIYGDFSGYSDIAIGTAKLFGIRLKRNFDVPYFSRNIGEFWRRWHISLTTWFKDYLYIPLGGSRSGKWITIRNTFIIFLVSGFWHGANWTFIFWGGFHALLFMPALLFGSNRKYAHQTVALDRLLPTIKEAYQILRTFILASIGWIIFRAPTIKDALNYLSCSINNSIFEKPNIHGVHFIFFFIIVMIIIEWTQRNEIHSFHKMPKFILFRRSLYLFITFSIIMFGGQSQSFIYFQF